MSIFEQLKEAIINGRAAEAKELTNKGLAEGIKPADFFPNVIVPAMNEVGRRMSDCEFYIPEVLIAARAARSATEILRPLLIGDEAVKPLATVAVGTVKGDLHDIGKNIVAVLLEGSGFRVLDLGTDVSPEKFLQSVQDQQAQIIGMSALLTTTMVNMKAVIKALEDAGVRSKVKVMVGGAPVTDSWAKSIGADGYGKDAPAAVVTAKELIAQLAA